MSILRYSKPAPTYIDGLPIGNGRLAAMVIGEPAKERIALNHEWLWCGKKRDRKPKEVSQYLGKIRELLFSEQYIEGTELANQALSGCLDKPDETQDAPAPQTNGGGDMCDDYIPAGDLYFETDAGDTEDYVRSLDLDKAEVTVAYGKKVRITRRAFADFCNNVIVYNVKADGGKVSGILSLDRKEDPNCRIEKKVSADTLTLSCLVEGGIDFTVQTKVICKGGKAEIGDDCLKITDADEILTFTDINPSFINHGLVSVLPSYDYDKLLEAHAKKYSELFSRVELDIGCTDSDKNTDERVNDVRNGGRDAGLIKLYFDYGRYLFISSSAGFAELPANLQGKWNEDLTPPWCSDYHFDINLQMNYWLANPCNLAESNIALFNLLERYAMYGEETAMNTYACRGTLFPISGDVWGVGKTYASHGWCVWIAGAGWLSLHFWNHWEYTHDIDFLRDRAYPFLRKVAEFYLDYVVIKDGEAKICPSYSPENRFEPCGNFPVSLGVNCAMDVEILHDVLVHTIKASEILNEDAAFRTKCEELLAKTPLPLIGKDGRLLEWDHECKEVEPGHRHISHLYGIYPSDMFTVDEPDYYNASIKSLDGRLSHGGGHTGWSRAWTACCCARIGRGDDAYDHLERLVYDFATTSLLDLHPPRIFQIDGNFGGTAAVVELLLQSYRGVIELLPALPSAWAAKGHVKGLKARGNVTVDIEWENGRMVKAVLYPENSGEIKIRKPDGSIITINAEGGKEYTLNNCYAIK